MTFGSLSTFASVAARLAELEQMANGAMTMARQARTTAQGASAGVAAVEQSMATKADLTPLQQAAQTASSTISASDTVHATLQAEIDALTKTKYWLSSEVVQLPSIAAGGTSTVTVTWTTPAPTTDYSCTAALSDPGALLGSLSVAVDLSSRTTTSVKIKVKNGGLVALSLNLVQVLVIGARGYRPT